MDGISRGEREGLFESKHYLCGQAIMIQFFTGENIGIEDSRK